MSAHGSLLRGLMSTSRSENFNGRFGRMFRNLRPATYGASDNITRTNLMNLGAAMTSDEDAPKDGADDEESGIPALYTYFGQFIDHDLTFDPNSSLQKASDPDSLIDYRTPAFDLDNVYGRGPSDQPYLYANDGKNFLLGDPISGGSDPSAVDLPRNNANPRRALIGDPRNDENSIVSQFQGLALRFHNRILADNPAMPFAEAQRQLRFHYQYVILNDFLPRIIDAGVLAGLKNSTGHFDQHQLQFFRPRNSPFMPVEFSVACYRLGHSMVRPGYRLNDNNLLPIFALGAGADLRGFKAMDPNRAMDWGRMIDTDIRAYDGAAGSDANTHRLQFAYRIDTSLVNPLANLPASVASDPPPSLAQRNLIRGFELGLPSGQSVARAMHQPVICDEQILIGKAVDNPQGTDVPTNITDLGKQWKTNAFVNNCPLWTYILAEAMQHKATVTIPVTGNVQVMTPRLGPVGGRIVAEVFLGLMLGDSSSLLRTDPAWTPAEGAAYTLKDFVLYAVGKPAAKTAGAA